MQKMIHSDINMHEVETIARHFTQNQLILTTAESCTGGWIAKALTDLAGSSLWFDRGFVTYSNQSKQEMLGVQAHTLAEFGAVSEQTVLEMAQGALNNSNATVSVATSGIAGPAGGTPAKPIGTVCLAWVLKDKNVNVVTRHFTGNREQVRAQSVTIALKGIIDLVSIA